MLDQSRYAVERYPPVISDNPSPAVGIGQTRQNMRTTTGADVRSISVKDSIIVCFAILRECFDDFRVRLVAICLQRSEDHAQTAVGHDGAFERCIRLKPDNNFVVTINVTGSVRRD